MGTCVVTIGGRPVRGETHAIVLPQTATRQERHAAEELRGHLAQITSEELPVVAESELSARIPLVVGKSNLLSRLGVAVDFAGLGEEGIHLETKGPALVLAGNRWACSTRCGASWRSISGSGG